MSERTWTPAQQQCIHDNGGTLLVSAAAGSGKTSVLVERILRKITDPDHAVDIDRMLVVTFTNAAAAEMKHRIASELTKRIAEHPTDRHLQRQQLALPRAAISTVHSFCINLVRENAHLLNLSPRFKIAEEQQLLLLRKEALEETLNTCYAEQDPTFLELAAMLSNGKNDALLMSTVEQIYGFIQSHPYPDQWLDHMAKIYEENQPIHETVWGQLVLTQVTDTLRRCVKQLHTAAALCSGNTELSDKYLPAIQADITALESICRDMDNGLSWDECFARCCSYKLTDVKSIRKSTDENAKQRVTSLRKAVRSDLTSLRDLYVGTEDQCREDLERTRDTVGALYTAVRRFSACFAEKKRAQDLLDFNDTEHFALQLLTTLDENGQPLPTPLARELSEQFDEIMVDEYQDTNASQDALFSALSRDERNLFYVGDVKQSIYRFRQAMPELFIRRRGAYAPYDGNAYPATISLGNNFRSRREVTDSVNFIFRQLMSKDTGGIVYDDSEQLVYSAGYAEEDGHETECLILSEPELKAVGLGRNEAEARVIAERIRQCLSTPCVTDKEGLRPARYGDFCILLRNKKTHAAVYREELERQGIPVSHESGGNFLDTAEIRLAISLLRCIDNPALDVPLTAVMLSPLFGFSPEDLAQIRLHRQASCLYVSVCAARRHDEEQLAKRCRDFLVKLDLYRSWAAALPVDGLLRRVYDDTALPEIMGARSGGATRRKNLQLLYDHCHRFEQNGFRGLSSFVRYVDRLREQKADLGAAAAPATTGDAVRILSIHGSKGLEFPIVFVAGLGVRFNTESLSADLLLHPTLGAGMKLRDPETFNRYTTLPHQALAIALRNDSREEDLRILYVALTRAREKLYLLVTPQGDPLQKLDFLAAQLPKEEALPPSAILGASSMAHWILMALLRHPSADELRRHIDREDLIPLPAQTPWRITLCKVPEKADTVVVNEVDPAPDTAFAATVLERMAYTYPHDALSHIPAKLAASMAAHTQTARQHLALSRPAFMSGSELTPAERGTAMHTFMQFSSYEAAADDLPTEIDRLVNDGFLTRQQADSLNARQLSAFFGSPLYARMARSSRCLREYHFTYSLPASQWNADLETDPCEFVVVQGIADCLFEEDGKLMIVDYKTDKVKTPEELVERYRPQLALYREALAKVLNMPIGDCLLYSFALGTTIVVK